MPSGQLNPPAGGRLPRRVPHRLPARGTDRVEAAAAVGLTALALILVVVGWWAGIATHEQAARREAAAGPRHPVSAVVTDAPPVGDEFSANGGAPAAVTARWSGADGLERVRTVMVSDPVPAGSAVTVWVDERGDIAPAPAAPNSAAVAGAVVGVLVLAGGWSLLLGCWLAVRRAIEMVNHKRWAAQWSQVEPVWSGRSEVGD